MCVRSQFGQVFRLNGDPKRDRGQSHSTQNYNGLSGSYLQEMSVATTWSVGISREVHIPFHRPIKIIFYHSDGSQMGRLGQGV